jgi:hypothetical protein
MSWSCTLTADKDIQECHVDAIVDTLPEDLKFMIPGIQPSKQEWGWSCATDISKPRGRKLFLSGAGFSAGKAEAMRDYLKKALEICSYKVCASEIED